MSNLYVISTTTITPTNQVFTDGHFAMYGNASPTTYGYTLVPGPTGTQSSTTTLVANVDSSGTWTTSWMDNTAFNNALTIQRNAQAYRHRRNELLAASDWTQFADSPLNSTQKTAWSTYRTALRNVPQQAGFPTTFTWPVKP
jgi:DNA-binding ferritin-like protein (Dps family)